jgi:hypothetical protein
MITVFKQANHETCIFQVDVFSTVSEPESPSNLRQQLRMLQYKYKSECCNVRINKHLHP